MCMWSGLAVAEWHVARGARRATARKPVQQALNYIPCNLTFPNVENVHLFLP